MNHPNSRHYQTAVTQFESQQAVNQLSRPSSVTADRVERSTHARKQTSRRRGSSLQTPTYLLAMGSIVVFITLLFKLPLPNLSLAKSSAPNIPCQGDIQPQAVLDRDALLKLLSIPERQNADTVRDIVQEPYCQLPDLEIRAGVVSQREVYPLAFDPQTWLVILYEGDEYAGYAFHVQR